MKKSSLYTLIVLVSLLLICASATYYYIAIPNDAANSAASKNLQSDEKAVYTDLQGNPFSFDEFQGQVRVVNAWASWVPFSTAELKNFETLATEFKDQKVAVIAINRKEPKEFAEQYLNSLMQFQNVRFAIDITDAFYTSVSGYAMPETVFYDTRGNIVFQKHGDMTLEEMRMHTEDAITASK